MSDTHDSECESRTEFEYVRGVKYCAGCGGGDPGMGAKDDMSDDKIRDKLTTLEGIRAVAFDQNVSDHEFRCRVDDYFAALDAGDPLL